MFEIGGIVILGILAQWIAWRFKLPAILPLIIIGLGVGPIAEFLLGFKIISPVYDPVDHTGIFPDDHLFHFVSLSIGLILFEGGLTLQRREVIGHGASIGRLVTYGSIITFLGGAVAAHTLFDISWQISFLFSSLIIVTGPTVIAPLLRNLNLNQNVATVLKWEGILIDPIGALIAVLVFNFINAQAGNENAPTSAVLLTFIRSVLIGLSLGVSIGYGLYLLIKKVYVPEFLLNTFTLALVLGAFIFSDVIAHESGLLTVVIMGMTLANLDVPHFQDILDFKESITILLISALFILLSANISIEQVQMLGWPFFALFLVVILLRPIAVFLSMRQKNLNFKEKLFISWVGPRGIVAAGVASLFGLKLTELEIPGAELITPLVFFIVLGTVVLNATAAGLVGKWLNVTLHKNSGMLLIGAGDGPRMIAKYLENIGRKVMLLDNSPSNINKALAMDLDAHRVDIFNKKTEDLVDLPDLGYLLAMTSSEEINFFATNNFSKSLEIPHSYRLPSDKEVHQKGGGKDTLFSPLASYLVLNRVTRQAEEPRTIKLSETITFETVIQYLRQYKGLPLFLINKENRLKIITSDYEENEVEDGDELVYLFEMELTEELILNKEIAPKAATSTDETMEDE
ncbi:MAG: sodium/hydrogen exchanger [Saprospiraceae bacterium]|nr:MAG: sodium/hydrogen exchanger [Saprospiraceae bacterium]